MNKKDVRWFESARLIMKGYSELCYFYAGLDDLLMEKFSNMRSEMCISIVVDLSHGIMDTTYLTKKKEDVLFQLRKARDLSIDNPFFVRRKISRQLIKSIENVR